MSINISKVIINLHIELEIIMDIYCTLMGL